LTVGTTDPLATNETMKIESLFSVRDLSVMITGGASGIGLAIAEAFAGNGARVTIADVNQAAIADQLPRLQQFGAVHAVEMDITDKASVEAGMKNGAAANGGIDVLFANAGADAGSWFLDMQGQRIPGGEAENFDEEDWDKVIAINLTGVMRSAKAVIPYMKAKGGRIIVTTSIAALMVSPAASLAYFPSKAGAAHLVRRLALELARYNILVNAIAPGGVVTNIADGIWRNEAMLRATERAVPLHRVAQPEDLQGVALFLASRASSYITGREIVVDGGMTLGMAD